jgi:tripartite-type tricarboxylate transporter receptor subunit TctC
LPTVAASGLPGYEYLLLQGMFAPGGTPPAIVKQLNQHAVQALNRADIRDKFSAGGVETIASSPEAFISAIRADTARLGKVIKDAGIRIE